MRMNILVVDNHPLILKFMTGLLSKEGHHVVTAQDGLSALDILKSYTPRVVFIDLIMPNISGEKLCRIIRTKAELRDAYLVILSAVAVDAQTDYREFGADACIAKAPFEQMGRYVLDILKEAQLGPSATSNGTPLGSDAIRPREITRELLSVKHHFEVILGSMAEGVLEITSGGRIVYANPSAIALLGIPEERLLTSTFIELFPQSDRETVRGLLEVAPTPSRCVFADSPLVIGGKQVSLKVVPIREEGSGAVVILEDVTERRHMEVQLLNAQKMEAMGRLAGGIAHDFNNLLTAITGNVSLAKTCAPHGTEMLRMLREIERASWRARDLAQQLLPFSKGGAPIRRVASIPSIIEEACLDCLRGSEVHWEFRVAEDLWEVEVDPKQIRQVLKHLLMNAVEAMPQGGMIQIVAENLSDSVKHGLLLKAARYIQVSIQDQGGGIAEEHLSRIFDPYFTTKEMGRGLGLTTAYSIIQQHQGAITVESKPGAGSIFHIYLRAAERESVQPKPPEATDADRRSRVLLMDDEAMVRDIAARMLQHLGCTVALARDGGEAIELYETARQKGEPFDLVVLDLTVPDGIGGRETVQVLLGRDPQIRAIVSSGYSNDPVMADYQAYGFSGVLEKPYQISELRSELQRVLGNWAE